MDHGADWGITGGGDERDCARIEETTMYYGPGELYMIVTNLATVGTEVQVYGVDRCYALIDYAINADQRTRS